MITEKKQLKQKLTLILFSVLLSVHSAIAATDLAAQESYLRARAMNRQQDSEHANHAKPIDKSLEFHGIFYGYLPCDDCNGIKTTLSLKQKNNYLLVTQPARDSSKEYYEKGKYSWNEETHTVVLTPRNQLNTRQYFIKEEGVLVQLNSDGTPMPKKQADRYTLRRSDTAKTREVHIH